MTADDRPAEHPRCTALTRAGDQCARRARPGELTCKIHSPDRAPNYGRPTKLTPELIATLTDLLARGAYREQACAAVGIAKTSLYSWLERAEADHEAGRTTTTFAALLDAVTRAEAQAEQEALEAVRIASRDDWRAAAWYLERRHPDRWRRRDRVEVDAQVAGTTDRTRTVEAGSEERIAQIAEVIAAAQARPAAVDLEDTPEQESEGSR